MTHEVDENSEAHFSGALRKEGLGLTNVHAYTESDAAKQYLELKPLMDQLRGRFFEHALIHSARLIASMDGSDVAIRWHLEHADQLFEMIPPEYRRRVTETYREIMSGNVRVEYYWGIDRRYFIHDILTDSGFDEAMKNDLRVTRRLDEDSRYGWHPLNWHWAPARTVGRPAKTEFDSSQHRILSFEDRVLAESKFVIGLYLGSHVYPLELESPFTRSIFAGMTENEIQAQQDDWFQQNWARSQEEQAHQRTVIEHAIEEESEDGHDL